MELACHLPFLELSRQSQTQSVGPCSEQREMRAQFLGKCLQSHNCFPSCGRSTLGNLSMPLQE